jgi:hypothetical protein
MLHVRQTPATDATSKPQIAATRTQRRLPQSRKIFTWCTWQDVRDYTNSCRIGSTSTSPCAATTRLRPHALYVDLPVRRDYPSPAARDLRRPRRAPQLLVSGYTRSTSTLPSAASTRLPAAAALHQLRLAQARRRLLCLHRASGCLDTSRGSSRGSSRRPSSTTPPLAGSSSTTPPHAGSSSTTRRRLLRLRRASGCLGTSRGSSRGSSRRSSSTTSPTPCV